MCIYQYRMSRDTKNGIVSDWLQRLLNIHYTISMNGFLLNIKQRYLSSSTSQLSKVFNLKLIFRNWSLTINPVQYYTRAKVNTVDTGLYPSCELKHPYIPNFLFSCTVQLLVKLHLVTRRSDIWLDGKQTLILMYVFFAELLMEFSHSQTYELSNCLRSGVCVCVCVCACVCVCVSVWVRCISA